jgi:hypothetical protein
MIRKLRPRPLACQVRSPQSDRRSPIAAVCVKPCVIAVADSFVVLLAVRRLQSADVFLTMP